MKFYNGEDKNVATQSQSNLVKAVTFAKKTGNRMQDHPRIHGVAILFSWKKPKKNYICTFFLLSQIQLIERVAFIYSERRFYVFLNGRKRKLTKKNKK